MSSRDVEKIAERIRTFSKGVKTPEEWMIVVPAEEYDDVKAALDTTKDVGTYYQGISLCCGNGYDETQVKLKRSLIGYLEAKYGADSDTDEIPEHEVAQQ